VAPKSKSKSVAKRAGGRKYDKNTKPPTDKCNGIKRNSKSGKKERDNPEYCDKTAGWGTDHPGFGRCKFHGGNNPGGRKNGAMLMAAAEVEMYGLPEDIDPLQALEDELARTAGHVAWLRLQIGQVIEWDPDDPDFENKQTLIGPVGGGQGGYPEYKPHALLQLYRAERKHLVEVAAICIKVGIDERRVRLAEGQGGMIAMALKGILEDLGVADHPDAPQIVRKHLLALEKGRPSDLHMPTPHKVNSSTVVVR
jgi:hypothetical protein